VKILSHLYKLASEDLTLLAISNEILVLVKSTPVAIGLFLFLKMPMTSLFQPSTE
jgi:hypothetical protein